MISALFAGIYGHIPRTLLLALLVGSLTVRSASAKGDSAEQHAYGDWLDKAYRWDAE